MRTFAVFPLSLVPGQVWSCSLSLSLSPPRHPFPVVAVSPPDLESCPRPPLPSTTSSNMATSFALELLSPLLLRRDDAADGSADAVPEEEDECGPTSVGKVGLRIGAIFGPSSVSSCDFLHQ